MSDAPKNDETKTDDTPTDAPEATDEDKATEPESTEDEGKEDEEPGEPKTFDEKYVTDLRNEAANWRTKLREAEDKLKNAKSLEEVDALVTEIKTEREKVERELLVEVVATKYKLPEALAKRLSGDTREALEADAKELAALVGTEQDDDEDTRLEGGLTPRDRDSDPDSPRELARKYGRRR